MSDRVVLPGEKPKPSQSALPFPAGAKVFLKCCPADDVGTVTGMQRGKVVVDWGSLNYTGKHKPESLTLAEDEQQ